MSGSLWSPCPTRTEPGQTAGGDPREALRRVSRPPRPHPCTPPPHLPEHSATHTCCPSLTRLSRKSVSQRKANLLGSCWKQQKPYCPSYKNPFAKTVLTKRKAKRRGVVTTEGQSKPFQVLTQANWFLKSPVSEQERKALSCHATQLGRRALPTDLYKLLKTPFV